MSTTTPAGWYDDGHGALRWWDGAQWTEHVHTPDAAPEPVYPTSDAPDPSTVSPIPLAPAGPAPVYVPDADYGAAAGAAGYPGYSGGSGTTGVPGSPPSSTKSRLWIVFVILGVVLVGLIIAASIIIPRLISAVSDGGDPGAVSAGDEKAAVQVVEDYDDAWDSADCDEYIATTTERFRNDGGGFTECAEFEDQATAFSDSTEDYEIAVTGTSREGDSILIETTETYLVVVDDEGNPVDDPEQSSDVYTYVLVPQDSGWAIDEIR